MTSHPVRKEFYREIVAFSICYFLRLGLLAMWHGNGAFTTRNDEEKPRQNKEKDKVGKIKEQMMEKKEAKQ